MLECNAEAVRLFGYCRLAYVSTGAGAVCLGFEPGRIEDAARVFQIQLTPKLAADVMLMGSAAAEYLNKRKGS